MQPLVHRECHQLPKPHMGAPHVLSISPILVIDDNHFQESLIQGIMHHHAMQQPIMHAYEVQTLRNTNKARKDDSLNSSTKLSETSPPLASIAKMGEKLRRPI